MITLSGFNEKYILGMKQPLLKMNLSDSEHCRIYNSNAGILILKNTCEPVNKLWNNLKHWLNEYTGTKLNFIARYITFGYLLKTDVSFQSMALMFITKS